MQDVANLLNPLERKILPHLKDGVTSQELVNFTGLKDVEVVRALQWLENKNLVQTKKEEQDLIDLDENGIKCLKEGLPEKRFLKALNKPLTIQEVKKQANLDDNELNVAFGLLKRFNLVQPIYGISPLSLGIMLSFAALEAIRRAC